jgi:hypothetical protein
MKKKRGANVNKTLVLSLFSILLISFIIRVVSAEDTLTVSPAEIGKAAWEGFKQGVLDITSPIIADTQLVTQILFGLLLFMVIYSIIESIFNSRWTTWIISLAVTILSFIAIPVEFLSSILLSYGAMGAAILSVIPFLIILVFTIRIKSLLAGRILWIFFCVYYFALAIYGWAQTGYWTTGSIIYGFAVVAGILIFFLIGSVRRAIFKGQMKDIKESGKRVANKAKLLHLLQSKELREAYAQGEGQEN